MARRPRPSRRAFPELIGVIHLPALPGAPSQFGRSAAQILADAGRLAVQEALLFERAGFDAVMVENFGDAPFFGASVPPETVAAMSVIATAVSSSVKIPVGVNILRNDAHSALAVAAVSGSTFIRVNVLSGVAATDQGIIQGDAASVLRKRGSLAPDLQIWADVWVKHAVTLSSKSLEIAMEDTALRACADALILSGETTGRAVDLDTLERAARVAQRCQVPLYVGSGATAETVNDLLVYAQGVIVSSALRRGRKAGATLDTKALKNFVKAARTRKTKAKPRSRR